MSTSRIQPIGSAAPLKEGWDEEDEYGRRSLSRSTTDRDAARRTEPGLLRELAADPATRLVLVDTRGRIALDAPAMHPDLPEDGLTPPAPSDRDRDVWEKDDPAAARPSLAPLTAADLGAGVAGAPPEPVPEVAAPRLVLLVLLKKTVRLKKNPRSVFFGFVIL